MRPSILLLCITLLLSCKQELEQKHQVFPELSTSLPKLQLEQDRESEHSIDYRFKNSIYSEKELLNDFRGYIGSDWKESLVTWPEKEQKEHQKYVKGVSKMIEELEGDSKRKAEESLAETVRIWERAYSGSRYFSNTKFEGRVIGFFSQKEFDGEGDIPLYVTLIEYKQDLADKN